MNADYEGEMMATFVALEKKHDISGRVRQFIDASVRYHGFPAPGVILGAYMVDLALEKLGAEPGDRLFAVAETAKCVSDSIGVITGCTPGSSKFLLFNTGRIALAVGRDDGTGIARCVRAYVVCERTRSYPALRAWYFNEPDAKGNLPALLEDILVAGRGILGWERVDVPIPPKDDQWKPAICASCGEMVPDKMLVGDRCRACSAGSCYMEKK